MKKKQKWVWVCAGAKGSAETRTFGFARGWCVGRLVERARDSDGDAKALILDAHCARLPPPSCTNAHRLTTIGDDAVCIVTSQRSVCFGFFFWFFPPSLGKSQPQPQPSLVSALGYFKPVTRARLALTRTPPRVNCATG